MSDSFSTARIATLEKRKAALVEEFEAANRHLMHELDEADRIRIKRRVANLEAEIEELLEKNDWQGNRIAELEMEKAVLNRWFPRTDTPEEGMSLWIAVREWSGHVSVQYAQTWLDYVNGDCNDKRIFVHRYEGEYVNGKQDYGHVWPPEDVVAWRYCDDPEFDEDHFKTYADICYEPAHNEPHCNEPDEPVTYRFSCQKCGRQYWFYDKYVAERNNNGLCVMCNIRANRTVDEPAAAISKMETTEQSGKAQEPTAVEWIDPRNTHHTGDSIRQLQQVCDEQAERIAALEKNCIKNAEFIMRVLELVEEGEE